VTFGTGGLPKLEDSSGADALNAVELGRIRTAIAAYWHAAALL
jgi:hypothetical protein